MSGRAAKTILMVSDFEGQGGAAVAASRLAGGLVRRGHTVVRVVAYPDGQAHPWTTMTIDSGTRPAGVARRIAARFLRRSAPLRRPYPNELAKRARQILSAVRPDVVNLHNIHGATRGGWSLEMLRVFAAGPPVVWTLHDMWSFTGRCAYSGACQAFLGGCDDSCPTPEQYPALSPELIAPAWQQRQRFLADFPEMVAAAPSRWLATEASRGLWRGHRVEHVPYGVPLAIYTPRPKTCARSVLGLPRDRVVIAMSGAQLDSPFKGLDLAKAALQTWSGKQVTVLTMGSGSFEVGSSSVEVCALGNVADERLRAIGYAAADALVHPAISDNLPNVIIEAIACDTPVVAFAVGGIPELVRPGITGWLAGPADASSLRTTLAEALRQLELGQASSLRCRPVAETEYAEELAAERYGALFDSLA